MIHIIMLFIGFILSNIYADGSSRMVQIHADRIAELNQELQEAQVEIEEAAQSAQADQEQALGATLQDFEAAIKGAANAEERAVAQKKIDQIKNAVMQARQKKGEELKASVLDRIEGQIADHLQYQRLHSNDFSVISKDLGLTKKPEAMMSPDGVTALLSLPLAEGALKDLNATLEDIFYGAEHGLIDKKSSETRQADIAVFAKALSRLLFYYDNAAEVLAPDAAPSRAAIQAMDGQDVVDAAKQERERAMQKRVLSTLKQREAEKVFKELSDAMLDVRPKDIPQGTYVNLYTPDISERLRALSRSIFDSVKYKQEEHSHRQTASSMLGNRSVEAIARSMVERAGGSADKVASAAGETASKAAKKFRRSVETVKRQIRIDRAHSPRS